MISIGSFNDLVQDIGNGVVDCWNCVIVVPVDFGSLECVDEFEFEMAIRVLSFEEQNSVRAKKCHDDGFKLLCNKLLQLFSCRLLLGVGSNADVCFKFNEFGKPFVDGLSFNMSNGDGLVGMVLQNRDNVNVGIDIASKNDYSIELRQTADVFSEDEKSLLSEAVDIESRRKLFAHLWSLKECYIKCLGTGLSYYNKLSSLDYYPELKAVDYTDDIQLLQFKKRIDGTQYTFLTFQHDEDEIVTICSPATVSTLQTNIYSLDIQNILKFLK